MQGLVRRWGASAAAASLALAWAGAAAASPGPVAPAQIGPQLPGIVGGEASSACAWPNVVAMQGGGLCTGTLIHPRVVAYAAHCGTLHAKVYFGEDVTAPTRERETLYCERNSDIFAVSSTDYAFCVLAEPVEDIPVTPPLAGCETELIEIGTPVTIVGFGDTTSEGPAQTGIKHEAQTQITGLLSMIGIGGMGTGADAGDSGGPALVQLEDGSWRLLGIVSGGGGDGGTVQYVPAPQIIAWIEDQSGIDISPCYDIEIDSEGEATGEASWAPRPACEGFLVATQADASWAQGCPTTVSGPSDSCGLAWTEIEDLDAPTVSFIDPLDEDALLGPPTVFNVRAEADDGEGIGVAGVRLRVDGEPWLDAWEAVAVDEVAPYRFDGVRFEAPGAHELELEAVDALGNVGVTAITVYAGDSDSEESGEDPESGGGSSTQTGGESESSGSEGGAAETGTGCGCTANSERGGALGLLGLGLLGLGLGLRRRR